MDTVIKTTTPQEDAQLVIEVLSEKEAVQLDYSAASVSWLDTYIDRHRNQLDTRDKQVLQEKFGAFLGESIRHAYGGDWVCGDENRWLIEFGDKSQTSPFEIIGEHLEHRTSLSQVFEHMPERI